MRINVALHFCLGRVPTTDHTITSWKKGCSQHTCCMYYVMQDKTCAKQTKYEMNVGFRFGLPVVVILS